MQFEMASIFDLDHTLLVCNSSFRFGWYLYRKKTLPFVKFVYLLFQYLRLKANLISLSHLQNIVFSLFFAGRSYQEMQDLALHFVDSNFENLRNPKVESFLRDAQNRGEYTAILSNSPSFLVKHIARRFGVNEWAATQYNVDEAGRFHSISFIMLGEDKAAYVDKIARDKQISRENITVYSDSVWDIPFLLSGGKSIGVAPTRKLRSLCKRKQWQIIE